MKSEGRAMMEVEMGCSGAERRRRRCQNLGQPTRLLSVEMVRSLTRPAIAAWESLRGRDLTLRKRR